jgi:hypothetical protein
MTPERFLIKWSNRHGLQCTRAAIAFAKEFPDSKIYAIIPWTGRVALNPVPGHYFNELNGTYYDTMFPEGKPTMKALLIPRYGKVGVNSGQIVRRTPSQIKAERPNDID